jgi:hypothetical protein
MLCSKVNRIDSGSIIKVSTIRCLKICLTTLEIMSCPNIAFFNNQLENSDSFI